MKSNIFVDALKYGKEKLERRQEFTLEEIKNTFIKKGYQNAEIDYVFAQLINENFTKDGSKFRVNTEGYFRLLDYENLVTARRSNMWAWIGLIIAIILGGISVYQFFKPNTQEVEISKNQAAKFEQEIRQVNQSIQQLQKEDSLLRLDLKNAITSPSQSAGSDHYHTTTE